MMKRIYIISLLTSTLLLATSCGDEFLDVNIDPNNPSSAPIEMVFPAAAMSTASVVNGEGMILGGMWSQFWAQNNSSNQYKVYDQFDVTPTDFQGRYLELYAGALNDFERVRRQSREMENWDYYLMATVMQSYTFQVLADLYGETPFREALQGDDGLITPAFDSGELIYDSLIQRIEFALSKNLSDQITGAPDIIFGGNMVRWQQFANTFMLKLLVRQSEADAATASAGITALLSDPVGFLSVDAAIDIFVDQEGKSNPLFEQDRRKLNTSTNLKASNTLMSVLLANEDPRVDALFVPGSSNNGVHKGMLQGNHEAPSTVLDPLSTSLAKLQATDPAYFMTAAESYFLQAEAELRFGSAGNVQALYEAGVTAAFARLGLAAEAQGFIEDEYAYPDASMGENLEAIMMQKWMAFAGANHLEAFFELNRTNIPKRSDVAGDDGAYVPGELTRPINSVLAGNARPQRLYFPDFEVQRNSNTPAQKSLTDRIWWDTTPE